MRIEVKQVRDPASLQDVWEIHAPNTDKPFQRIAQLIEPPAQDGVGAFQAISPTQRYVDLSREAWHSARQAGTPVENPMSFGLGTSR